MAGLPVAHRVALTALIERASDAVLGELIKAVGPLPGERAEELRTLLAEQKADRARRAKAFRPLLPLFRPRTDGVRSVRFPEAVLTRLWATAREREPHLLPILDARKHPQADTVSDRLCAAGAAAVRDRPELIWPADLAPEARAAGLTNLAAALDLAGVLRRGLPLLQAWVKRPDEDQVAALRLLLRDCADIHPDGARRAIEVFFAHLDDAVLVLRILSQASEGTAREDFLGQSEMADFVDRLMASVETRVARIAAFDPAGGPDGIKAVIDDLDWCGAVLAELDITLELDAEGAWGRQSREARAALSRHIKAFLNVADKTAAKAFPMENARVAGRMTRKAPVLTAPSEGEGPRAAVALLRLVGALRGPASVFGVEAARGTLAEDLTARLTDWVDQALHDLDDLDADAEANALRLINLIAEGLGAIGSDGAARTVRRRVAAARSRQGAPEASSRAA